MKRNINVYDFWEESYKLYQANFSQFVLMSAIGSLLGLVYNIFSEVMIEYTSMFMISIVLILLLAYIGVRVSVTFMLFISDRYQNIESSIKTCYYKSKENIWKYIGYLLILAIIVAIPLTAIVGGLQTIDNWILEILLISTGVTLLLFVLMHYSLAPIICIFCPEDKNPLRTSYRLMVNRRIQVFYAFTAILIVELGGYYLLELIGIKGHFYSLYGVFGLSLETLIYMIIWPLRLCMILIFYLNLVKSTIGKEDEIT